MAGQHLKADVVGGSLNELLYNAGTLNVYNTHLCVMLCATDPQVYIK